VRVHAKEDNGKLNRREEYGSSVGEIDKKKGLANLAGKFVDKSNACFFLLY